MFRFYIYLFIALFIILMGGFSTLVLIITCGLIGATGNAILKAREDEKRQQKEIEERRRTLREMCDEFNHKKKNTHGK